MRLTQQRERRARKKYPLGEEFLADIRLAIIGHTDEIRGYGAAMNPILGIVESLALRLTIRSALRKRG
jgi:hypothetical protein